ncbi:MAG: lamin tail domain-containing protein [Kiritimatiellae bacterium]|nr:lamin tail domain-containing protein [Kiritimatiellia bacterium]
MMHIDSHARTAEKTRGRHRGRPSTGAKRYLLRNVEGPAPSGPRLGVIFCRHAARRGASRRDAPALLALLLAVWAGLVPCTRADILVARGTTWRYVKGTREASSPADAWRALDYGDTGWAVGRAPFGYGPEAHEAASCNTVLSDMEGRYTTLFLRRHFTVADAAAVSDLKLSVDYDDGFIVWLNGVPVCVQNAPDNEPGYNAVATAGHEAGIYQDFAVPDPGDCLESGDNVIAVQLFNAGADSTDAKLDVELSSCRRVADTTFSVDRGFYDAAFDVTIGTETPGATIRYTTDGSPPAETYGAVGGTRVVVRVSTTTCLRAAAFRGGYEPTDVDTHTYIFPAHVLTQSRPSGYPADWPGDPHGDYDMAPEVRNDARYSGTLTNDLRALRTLSIVLDKDDMFGGTAGIYTHAGGHGDAWERPTSVEIFLPDGSESIQVDCGIRLAGAASRWYSPKHSFRLYFRGTYGATKLRYPLFPDTPIDEFDVISLRAGANDSWIQEDKVPASNEDLVAKTQYLHDEYARKSQLACGRLASHGTFLHLYINGLYWGVYNALERPDGPFMADYMGGSEEDYDVVKMTSNYVETSDGNSNAWATVMAMCQAGVAGASQYAQLQQYVDVVNLADYMLLNFYLATGDWPWNNWIACRKRVPGAGFQFLCWDAEVSLLKPAKNNTSVSTADSPAYIHARVKSNPDYKMVFADRVYDRFFNGGALMPDKAAARYTALADTIDRAIVAESARWGAYLDDYSTNNYPVFTRDDHWIVERNWKLAQFFPPRTSAVLSQLRAASMYPSVDPPTFQQHGGAVASGFRLTMSNPNGSGVIYYTTDGADPRVTGGSPSGTAIQYTGPVALSKTTHVKARVFKTVTTWSAAHAATYHYTAHYSRIRITEIMYNPLAGAEHEFVEIKNTGSGVRGLSDMTLTGARYTFPPGTELAGGQSLVLVRDAAAFASRYPGVTPFGVFLGKLDNGGERLALLDGEGRTVTAVRYNDRSPWPEAADGPGYSLVMIDENGEPEDPANWRASNLIGGSPGYDDGPAYRVVINEVLSHTDWPETDSIELLNAGSAAVDIGGWYLSDSSADYRKFQIPAPTVLAAGGCVVFDEGDFNTPTNDPSSFAFSSHGDEVYLTKWDAAGNLQYLAEARFGGAQNGVAFGRYVTSVGEADFTAQSVTNTLGAANAAPLVGPVVINELMYHSVAGGLEFIELLNIGGQTVKLYDIGTPANTWQLDGAVEFTFPAGAQLAAGAFALVVPTDAAAFRATYAVPVEVQIFGPYSGVLDNGGESVKLWRPDSPDELGVPRILVDRVKYGDNSPWPECADGDGPSLERQDPTAYGNDPVNWAASLAAGGTPGAKNSGVLVPKTAGWKFYDRGQDLGTTWRQPAFDDSGWDDGNGPLGYGYPDVDTAVSYGDDPENKPITTYFRKAFTLGGAVGHVTDLTLSVTYDDGFVAYLNGQELLRASMPGGTISYGTTAASHSAAGYETFNVSGHADKLVPGVNVLAVEVHQVGANSSDLLIDLELTHAASEGDLPAAPTGLAASAASQTRIDLRWTDASNNETGFKVDRRQSGASEWDRIATTGANVSTYADTGLAAGTTYYYQVKAYNNDGNSAYSAIAGATTQDGPPAAPAALSATSASASRIDLRWTDASGNETGFRVERSPDGSSGWAAIATTAADTSVWTDSGLTPATPYYYRVRAYNGIGNSAYSNVDGATTAGVYVQFALAASAGPENVSPAELSVVLSEPSPQTVRVSYAVTGGSAAGGGTDYTLAAGTLTFAPGLTAGELALAVTDDAVEEPDETVVVTLSGPVNASLGARATHTYTIRDNDRLFVAYNDLSWETGQLAHNITLWTCGQSGLLADYASGQDTPVTLTVAGGDGPLPTYGANPEPGTEAHTAFDGILDCTGVISYYTTDLTLRLTGLDPALRYEFTLFGNRNNATFLDRYSTITVSDVDAFNNESSTGATFSGPADASVIITNGYNTVNGYVARFNQVDPGSDGDMTITVSDNASRFYANALRLRALSALPLVAFDAGASSCGEGSGAVQLDVSLSTGSGSVVTVGYAVTGGTASGNGVDYTLGAGTLTFSPGQTSRSIGVTLVQDTESEGDETVVVSLSNPANATLGPRAAHTCTILDDDGPVVMFTAYNDLCWDSAHPLLANITGYSAFDSTNGWVTSGQLVDWASGTNTAVTLSVGGNGTYYTSFVTQGGDPNAGTDAGTVFNGRVDGVGNLGYGVYTFLFTGLEPAWEYELVVYGGRDRDTYLDKLATFTLSDVIGFENESTVGAEVYGSGGVWTNDVTRYNTGYNAADGRVARFSRVRPGADGDILLTADTTAAAGGENGYINALMIRAVRTAGPTPDVKVARGAVWRWCRGTAEASDPAGAWRQTGYDDSDWNTGAAPLGYGAWSFGTVLDDMRYSYSSAFFRREFEIESPGRAAELRVSIEFDDGFVAWLNGEEVGRCNVEGDAGEFVPFSSIATDSIEPTEWSATLGGASMTPLKAGANLLAVQVFNKSLSSSDLFFDAELAVVTATVSDDQDEDGMPDSWEQAHFGGTSESNGGTEQDFDGDGVSNIDEFIAGTDPATNASYFAVDGSASGGETRISLPMREATGSGYDGFNRYYTLEWRGALELDGVWAGVPGFTNRPGADGTVVFTNSSPGASEYYRGKVWLDTQ